ncbi:MAG: 50S ribosomal protein L25 [Elusimicrobia bacterium]|nr:50S ribosomal protein L25 [Elusimicrobiota bacterium]
MEKFTLDVESRSGITKGEMRKLRGSGKIPAVIYGEKENLSLTVDGGKFGFILSKAGHNAIIDLIFSDKTTKTVLIKDIQKHVITRNMIHIDFYQVSMKKKTEVSVPVVLSGEAPGVKEGGVITLILRELKVKCLPTDIPEKITIEIGNLQIGNSVSVKDLVLPKNIEVLNQPDQIIVNVVSPTILEEVVPGPAEALAEPEVIGKGKKELEEGEEEAEGKPAAKPAEAAKKEAAPAKKEEKPKEEKKPEKK